MITFTELLRAFGFSEQRDWIILICSVLFLSNFFGGILAGFMFINAKSLVKPKLTERLSFRMFLLSEIVMVFAASYYHLFMIESIDVVHVIYWVTAGFMAPLLAVIGAQIVYVMFSGRIKAKEAEFIARSKRTQAARKAAAATQAPPKPKTPTRARKPARR